MPIRRVMVAYVAWMAALAVAFFAVTPIQDVLILFLAVSAAVAIGYGVRRFRPARASAWLMLGAALLFHASGRIAYDLLPGPPGTYKAHMWVAYALQLVMSILLVAGLLGLGRTSGRDRRASMIDTAILLLSAGLLGMTLIAVPYALTSGLPALRAVARVAFVLRDVVVLAVIVQLATTVRWTRSVALLVFGVFGFLTYDALLRLGRIRGEVLWGTNIELGWLLFLAAVGAAALMPTMASLGAPAEKTRHAAAPLRLGLLAASSLLPFALLLVGSLVSPMRHEPVVAAVSTVILILVLMRLAGVALTLRQQVMGERMLREAIGEIAAATDLASVAKALHSAVADLMPPGKDHGILIVDADASDLTQSEPTQSEPTQSEPARAPLVASDTLRPSIAEPLGEGGQTLAFALAPEGAGAGAGATTLYVRSDRTALAWLRPRLEVLATQASLALDRLRLNQEIIRCTNEKYFCTLAQTTTDVILMVDDHDRILFASPSAKSIFGTSNLRGAWLPGFVDDAGRPAAQRLLAYTRAGQALFPDRDRTLAPRREVGHGDVGRGYVVGEDNHGVGHKIRPDDVVFRGEKPAAPRPPGRPVEAGWVNFADWTVRGHNDRLSPVEVSCRYVSAEPSIRGLVVTLRDVTEQRRLERELTERELYDSLTGLANRLLFAHRVRQAVEKSAMSDVIAGMISIDLDDFKVVNDQLGYEIGDEVLKGVGRLLTESLPPGATVARIGGDSFAALVEVPDVGAVDDVAARLVAALEQPVRVFDLVVPCSASIGVATTWDARTAQDLSRHADLSLHAAKTAGKGQVRHYDPSMRAAVVGRLELRSALERALDDRALLVEYQPIIALDTGLTAGFEALLRWDHPTRGRLSPEAFIDIAEESGLIVPIGDWVLSTAMRQARRWERPDQAEAPFVGVNVSARQFRSPGFVDRVRRQLVETGLAPASLHLEITESLLLRDDDRVWYDLQRLRELGIRIAIDDFGTGYSALSYLRQVPLDMVKLDRMFVSTMPASAQQLELVEGIVRLAEILRLKVVAEGIETETERSLAAKIGCAYGQGFLFARPMSADDTLRWLEVEHHRADREHVQEQITS